MDIPFILYYHIPIPLLQNENGTDDSRSELLKFVTGDPPQAKRIWRNAVEQHTFFRYAMNMCPYTQRKSENLFTAMYD